MRALFYASLFEALDAKHYECSMTSAFRLFINILAPIPLVLDDPSTYRIHTGFSSMSIFSISTSIVSSKVVNLAMKYTNTYNFIAAIRTYRMSNSPNLVAHLTSRPTKSSLCKMILNG